MTTANQSPQILADTVISAAASYVMKAPGALYASFQVNATVNSASAKTAATGILAAGTLGGVTYTAVALASGLNSAGNAYTVAYTAGGTAGAEVVTVVGTAISVQIQSGVSTITQVRTAVNASGAAAAIVTATGTSATVVTTVAATAISAMTSPTTGVDSKFNIANNTVTISAHGFFTGTVVQATKSGAAFPTGISASTDYFVYKIDANTIALFDTLAHALAAVTDGTLLTTSTGVIDITADGTVSTTITLTSTTISGCSYKLQKSNDFVDSQSISVNNGGTAINAGNWIDLVAGESASVVTNTITVTANTMVDTWSVTADAYRVLFAISAGTVKIKVIGHST